jgi:hypothetical protein
VGDSTLALTTKSTKKVAECKALCDGVSAWPTEDSGLRKGLPKLASITKDDTKWCMGYGSAVTGDTTGDCFLAGGGIPKGAEAGGSTVST